MEFGYVSCYGLYQIFLSTYNHIGSLKDNINCQTQPMKMSKSLLFPYPKLVGILHCPINITFLSPSTHHCKVLYYNYTLYLVSYSIIVVKFLMELLLNKFTNTDTND